LPLEEISPDILDFVEEYIDRFVAWDLFSYFHENPDIERKPTQIAVEIGRKTTAIEPSLDRLVEQGILSRDPDEDAQPTYRYTATAEIKKKMDDFLAATRDRTNRLAIVSRVLQKEIKRL
jgi:DNA-binding MarR family transcriptional regulator